MAINNNLKHKIDDLKKEYDSLRQGKESLLDIIFEAELPESVYNSNAIENSTLTIAETEKILLDLEVSRDVSVREVFEARNLARVFEYIKDKVSTRNVDKELILFLHKMLISNIDESIAGRFRKQGEYVRVGTHVAPAPEQLEALLDAALLEYSANHKSYFLEKVSHFHLDFEHVHPFNDGNGRIGRVLINYQLLQQGFPPIIIRDKEKQTYYKSFGEFRDKRKSTTMDKVIASALMESLNKRITYMKGEKIIRVSDYAKKHDLSSSILLNKAKRQTIPAFREKGVWKIGEGLMYSTDQHI
jgi:Fic family protein